MSFKDFLKPKNLKENLLRKSVAVDSVGKQANTVREEIDALEKKYSKEVTRVFHPEEMTQSVFKMQSLASEQVKVAIKEAIAELDPSQKK